MCRGLVKSTNVHISLGIFGRRSFQMLCNTGSSLHVPLIILFMYPEAKLRVKLSLVSVDKSQNFVHFIHSTFGK